MSNELPISVRLRIERECDRFEQEWRDGNRPLISEYLADWQGVEAEELLIRLLELDAEYRKQVDASLKAANYRSKLVGFEVTVDSFFARQTHPPAPKAESGDDETSQTRFLPGQVLVNRYRIVSQLGQGAMGEVYRADDLKLGGTVALKFLNHRRTDDAQSLRYFYDEVRLSQRVAHPHVCRVHDLVETDDLLFLTMEYIEGENLQVLLRRIGQLPHAKALELAHQLCQGIAVAHDEGVLHRDLKPANIMLDEQGRVRITDFGLAREHEKSNPNEALVGSPSYMAPEQFARNETSVQSDLFSLGLVLFELFTGRAAHRPTSLDELAEMHTHGVALQAVSNTSEIPRSIGQAIASCLAEETQQRPRSARELAELLPGASPLSAVIAAGSTPSPEMVAAADSNGELTHVKQLTLLSVFVALLVVAVLLYSSHWPRSEDMNAPATLLDQANEALELIDCIRGKQRAWGYAFDRDHFRWRAGQTDGGAIDPILESGYFWYRESRLPLSPLIADWTGDHFLTVDEARPASDRPGDIHVRLTADGKLRYFSFVPAADDDFRSSDASGMEQEAEPWNKLLRLAGIDGNALEKLEPVDPTFSPPGFADERRSWHFETGETESKVHWRIDAARVGSVPCFFRMTRIGAPSASHQWDGMTRGDQRFTTILLFWIPLLFLLTGFFARQNITSKRADRAGANRLACFAIIGVLLMWLLGSHHYVNPLEIDMFVTAAGGAVLLGAVFWGAYVAFEPFVRRNWPLTLVSWSRMFQGHWSDPIVGRDVLVGVVAGLLAVVGKLTIVTAPSWFGLTAYGLPNIVNFDPANGLRSSGAEIVEALVLAVFYSLFFQLLFLVGLKVLFRKTIAAVIAFVVFFSIMVAVQYQPVWFALLITAAEMSITVWLFLRVGLMAVVSMHFVRLMMKWPMTFDRSHWFAETGHLSLLVIVLVAAFATYLSRQKPSEQRLNTEPVRSG